ncbi:DUF1249 domain-containing protein [Thorsellia anophelis]|uniref:DUF1249 domain-containing protein n=1 Tax=Thorsellia anophelis DSM 18579 TaxID=1123402 RepID=A0A1H9Y327_9GAMM|nr:DUF1249 domain-containing protein [Thorsellia anophelis]SES63234.1 hypothetical protein SAMN02583745_00026 [Thorsellia anophelis DSM 18579]
MIIHKLGVLPVSARQRYHPNLNTLLELAENNFKLITHLLPKSNSSFEVYYLGAQRFELSILEETNYTMLVSLSWILPYDNKEECNITKINNKLRYTNLTIRVYFDAKLAEVLAKNRSVYQGRYNYPNDDLLQVDEKERNNRFLYEWLKACILWGKKENIALL